MPGNKKEKSIIDSLATIPWGTHFCQFYQTKEDLLDILIPYFKAGLEGNQYCMWVTSVPLGVEEAKDALRMAVPDFDHYLAKRQIEIIPHTEWYLKDGVFNLKRVLHDWIDKLNYALSNGYDGMRVTGNTAWLEKKDWKSFADYEEELNSVIGRYRLTAICTYSLDKCGRDEVIDVIRNHPNCLIKRNAHWILIESSGIGPAMAALWKGEEKFLLISSAARDAIVMMDNEGCISYWNPAAERLFGYPFQEVAGKELHILLAPERYHEAYREGLRAFRETGKGKVIGQVLEVAAVKKDGTEFPVELSVSAVMMHGKWHAIGILRDISDRKRMENALRGSEELHRITLSNISDAVFITDDTGAFTFVCPGVDAIFGYSPAEVQAMGKIEKLLGDHLFEREELKTAGEIQNIEREVTDKRGNHHNLLVAVKRVSIKGGTVLYTCSDVTARTQWLKRVEKLNSLMLALRDINQELFVTKDEGDLCHKISGILLRIEYVKFNWIGLIEEGGSEIRPLAYAGYEACDLSSVRMKYDTAGNDNDPVSAAIKTGQAVIINDRENDSRYPLWKQEALKRGCASVIVVPLKYDENVIGVINICADRKDAFGNGEVEYLTEVAGDMAMGIKSLRLGKRLEQSLESIRKTLHGTINAVTMIGEMRDPYTAGHQKRVAQIATAIARGMGLSEDEVEGIRVAGCLHDTGKIIVPAEILSKPSTLNKHEYGIVREHVRAGYEILKDIEFPWPVARMVLQHHENLDGSGYPSGTKGEEIILGARILAVADVVEAMATHRPYRPAIGVDRALLEIMQKRGLLYDPAVVDACMRLFVEKGFKLH